MAWIILWSVSVLVSLSYGSYRIYKLYKSNCSNKEYLVNGSMLILYSTLIVGATGLLSIEVNSYHQSLSETSLFWVTLDNFASLLSYLAPFVFAAIGVNMVSHALTSNNA